MLPIASIYLRDLYDSTREFIVSRSPRLGYPFRALPPEADEVSDLGSALGTPAGPSAHPAPTHDHHLREARGCPTPPPSMRKNSRDHDPNTKSELARTHADVHRLEERCRVLEKTLRETKELVRTRDAEIERMRRERAEEFRIRRQEQQAAAAALAAQSRRSSGSSDLPDHPPPVPPKRPANGYLQNALPIGVADATDDDESSSEEEEDEEEEATDSEEERAHMRGLDTFLTKIDRWSGAQIIQALQDLNSEILQFAAAATELCTFDKYSRASPARTTQATKETAARLGPALARVLSSRDHAQDPILVQLALQSCVATCIARALSTFCFGFAAKPNAVLSQIYTQMYGTEVQSTSSRWRALTHRHIQELHPRLEDFAVNDLIETIFRWSSDIFIISGCSNPQKASTTVEGLRARFGAQVRRVAGAVYKLAKITREEIMSTNFEVVAVPHGEGFDHREMSDAFEDYGSSVGAVLCTTDLGLSCCARRADGFVDRRLLLKPKVVLESVADVLDPR
ncbi:hypothetical protein HWV62_43325 [Athelia sp. TMB]|nr:hypothetical protein HWV62_43325 [Athelia sp. TMB]